VRRLVLGPENRSTLIDVSLLGDLYCIEGKWAEGEKLLLETVTVQRRVLTDADGYTVRSMAALSLCYLRQHKFDEAEPGPRRSCGSGDRWDSRIRRRGMRKWCSPTSG
jgi:hypothetical protein